MDWHSWSYQDATFPPNGSYILLGIKTEAILYNLYPDHTDDNDQPPNAEDLTGEGSNQSEEMLWLYQQMKLSFAAEKLNLDGEHLGWKYDMLSLIPSSANSCKFGVCISGLFQDTSFQPRSSARITIRWGGEELFVLQLIWRTFNMSTLQLMFKLVKKSSQILK